MKRNVDLTENRIFTTPERIFTPQDTLTDVYIVLSRYKVMKPWDEAGLKMVASDLDLEIFSEKTSVFATGNKSDRAIFKRNYVDTTNQVCDICGRSSGKKPWAKRRCNCYSMIRLKKFPWKM